MDKLTTSLKINRTSSSRFCFVLVCLIFGVQSWTQTISDSSYTKPVSRKSDYTNEFFLSGGYNYSGTSFVDAGLRYYRLRNDGQASLAFAGFAVGCKFGNRQTNPIVVPYVGYQGQVFFLGYGIRVEYATWNGLESFGIAPEVGLSVFDMLRITGGYRFGLEKNDVVGVNGFTFSAIIGIPLSFFEEDN